ncbi:MAG: T9SS type A sorting domain-containing protein [Saprospiraceae bacterium]
MKKQIATLFLSLASILLFSQTAPFNAVIEEEPFPGFPALQSFVLGTHEGKWVLIGGRTDGLHQRQPFAAFDPDFNNTNLYVVDPATKQVWSKTLGGLPTSLAEQLQSSNMEYAQRGETLYLMGGYGYSPTEDEWITYPGLVAADLPGLVDAITNNTALAPHFRQVADNRVQVTGGYLGRLGDDFYLVGGQLFEGRYNPMGPNHGPGFVQEYANAIKKFRIEDDGTALAIAGFEETIDTANLHRRDYNLVPQVFPNGEQGFTAFSGVFQHNADLPWLNTVDVLPNSYTVNNSFNQYLNQYHTAHAALYSEGQNAMYSLFFGGISRYQLNANDVLVDDTEVPFVKTISLVVRAADGTMQEYKLGDMSGYLGSSAEFVPAEGLAGTEHGVLRYDELADGQLLGHIVGGIESTLPNVLFLNGDDLSTASGKVFKVFLQKQATPAIEISGRQYFGLKLFPNPANGQLTVNFSVPVDDSVQLVIEDAAGRALRQQERKVEHGEYEWYFDVGDWAAGLYFVVLRNGKYAIRQEFVKQ